MGDCSTWNVAKPLATGFKLGAILRITCASPSRRRGHEERFPLWATVVGVVGWALLMAVGASRDLIRVFGALLGLAVMALAAINVARNYVVPVERSV